MIDPVDAALAAHLKAEDDAVGRESRRDAWWFDLYGELQERFGSLLESIILPSADYYYASAQLGLAQERLEAAAERVEHARAEFERLEREGWPRPEPDDFDVD